MRAGFIDFIPALIATVVWGFVTGVAMVKSGMSVNEMVTKGFVFVEKEAEAEPTTDPAPEATPEPQPVENTSAPEATPEPPAASTPAPEATEPT